MTSKIKNIPFTFILFSFIAFLNINCSTYYPKHLLSKKQIREIKKDIRKINYLKPYFRGFEIKKSYMIKEPVSSEGLYYIERKNILAQKKLIIPIIILKNEYFIKTDKKDSLQVKTFTIKLKKAEYTDIEIENMLNSYNKGISISPLWFQHHGL